jgi:toxin ParE1/3/4
VSLPLYVRPEAEAELVANRDWYEQRREHLGEEFVTAIADAFDRIAHAPEQFAICLRQVRRAKPLRFPYIIYFRVLTDRIEVIGILHASRDPRLWQRRIQACKVGETSDEYVPA